MTENTRKDEHEHGRYAKSPHEITRRGWWDILMRIKNQMAEDNLNIVAAGIAFYAFLAIFPALAAIISIYGLVVNPQIVHNQLSQMSGFLPQETHKLIGEILTQIASHSSKALGWGVVISILLGLWSANRGTQALFSGLNIAYDQKENRNFFMLLGRTLLFTLGGVILVIVSMVLVIGLPAIINTFPFPVMMKTLLIWMRWPVLALMILGSLAITYRYAPNRTKAKWRWVTWGSTFATVLWLAGSLAFSIYISHFGNYDTTYGSVAAVVILLFWLYLTSYFILLGAEINAEMEHQTLKDSTIGAEKPMGKRGAFPADDLGKAA